MTNYFMKVSTNNICIQTKKRKKRFVYYKYNIIGTEINTLCFSTLISCKILQSINSTQNNSEKKIQN